MLNCSFKAQQPFFFTCHLRSALKRSFFPLTYIKSCKIHDMRLKCIFLSISPNEFMLIWIIIKWNIIIIILRMKTSYRQRPLTLWLFSTRDMRNENRWLQIHLWCVRGNLSICLPPNTSPSTAGHFLSCFYLLFVPAAQLQCSSTQPGVAIIHVITTLLPWQPCSPNEPVVQCWQLSEIRPPLVNLHRVQRGGRERSSDKRDRREELLLTGRRVSTLSFLQRDIIDGDVSLDAWSSDTFEYHLQGHKHVVTLYVRLL